ncbi:MAG: CoA ester lyase [Nitratireductor sp.]|nr:CoA ester lyase [Nitratireductor sp.]
MVFLPADLSAFRWRRSALFLPASNIRAIEKAASLAADTLIFDLEDAVGPGERETAFANLRGTAAAADFGNRETVVRTPAFASAEFATALEAALSIDPRAILLPKVESPATIAAASHQLAETGSRARLWAMIETPGALIDLAAIAGAGGRLEALVVGTNDLAKTTGARIAPGRAVLLPWLMQAVAAGRANGLAVLDGVYNRFRDLDGFAAECADAAAMGFDGKTLIHPTQIAIANAAFGPSEADLARARTIVAAFSRPENTDKGVIRIDGEMVERLHLEEAERWLAAAQQLPMETA